MTAIRESQIRRFLKLAGERLTGEWILLGGTVLPALGRDVRATVDIDLAPRREKSQVQNLELMRIAEDMGLPVEAINQAGAFFLRKIADYDEHLLVLHEGTNGIIYRPDLYLFVTLKMKRLTEADLTDCLEYIRYCVHEDEAAQHVPGLLKSIEMEMQLGDGRAKRLQRLKEALVSARA